MNGVLTEGGQRYFMPMIDDASRYCYTYMIKMKGEALNCLKPYKTEVENQLEKKIKYFRFDRGGEYFSNEFDLCYYKHGIIHEWTPPYLSQSNGVAKRKNYTLIDLVNTMLDMTGLSKTWWGGFIDFMSCPKESSREE
jgi:transposase InsO family protein